MTLPLTSNHNKKKDVEPLALGRDITKLVHNAGKQYQKRAPKPSMSMTTTERLKACLLDNSMTDVALVGDDGVPVPAIRCVLGSASPVLKHLLYTTTTNRHRGASDSLSSNSLTTKDEEGFIITLEPHKSLMVHIPGFRHETIKALVEYCCSDGDLRQTSFFKPGVDGSEPTLSSKDPAQAVIEMLDFAQLAINYEIPRVPQQVVDDFVTPLTRRHPQLACIVFNYLLTVEFPDHPQSLPGSLCSPTGSKSSSIIQQKLSKEAKETEKVVSAAAALTKLYTTSLNMIRTQPYAALVPQERESILPSHSGSNHSQGAISDDSTVTLRYVGGVLALHAETLGKILQDPEVEADELFLFCQLQRWHQHHTIQNMEQRAAKEEMDKQNKTPSHIITNTLHKMTLGGPKENENDDDDKEEKEEEEAQKDKEFDEDSFEFEANFNEFILSNADSTGLESESSSKGPGHIGSKQPPRSKESNDENWNGSTIISNSSEFPPPSSALEYSIHTTRTRYSCPDPTRVCNKLVEYLDLSAIDPVPLKEIVSVAEFVDQQQIMDALWEQTKAASEIGRLSFGSIVRGTGGPGVSVQGLLPGLTDSVTKKDDKPKHQFTKSHILVQGAGVDDCNGIYTQVLLKTAKSDGSAQTPKTKKDPDKDTSAKREIPSLMCPSSVSEASFQTETTGSRSSVNIPTGICLRFVKQAKRKQHKSKTWYLVCRRELASPEDLMKGNAAPFRHQWSIIEEDNRAAGQLRVLYEWEPEDANECVRGGGEDDEHPNANAYVFDSSTLQQFPENGWTSVRERYFPAPTCKWYRPRHGPMVLVVPPVIPTEPPEAKHAERRRVTKRTPPPPPPIELLGLEKLARAQRTEMVGRADSLVGLSIISSDSDRSRKAATTITSDPIAVNRKLTVGTVDVSNQTCTTATSSFRVSRARRRVSLADVSLDTSDAKSQSHVQGLFDNTSTIMTFEI